MAKVKYDNSEVEPGTFKQPTPGLYTMAVVEANLRDEDGHNDIEIILEVQGGEFDKARLWTYVGLSEASAWKFREFTDAIGLPPAGDLDTNKLVGQRMKVKVNADQWQGEYRARAGRFAPVDAAKAGEASNGKAAPAAEEAPKSKSTRGRRGKAAPAPEPEPEPEAENEDYSEWSIKDLLAAINEDMDLVAQLPEGFEDDQEFLSDFLTAADEGDDALKKLIAEVDDDEDETDYSGMTDAELKAALEEAGFDVPLTGRGARKKLNRDKAIELLEEADEEGGDDEPQPDYNDMSLDELKEEVQRRGLKLPKGRVPKPRLITMLEAEDSDGSDPFTS